MKRKNSISKITTHTFYYLKDSFIFIFANLAATLNKKATTIFLMYYNESDETNAKIVNITAAEFRAKNYAPQNRHENNHEIVERQPEKQ